MHTRWLLCLITLVGLAGRAFAEPGKPILTVYSSLGADPRGGFAWVEERRVVSIQPGYNRLWLEPLPGGVDAGSLRLLIEGETGWLRSLAQTFRSGVGGGQPLVALYVGKPVRVLAGGRRERWISGTLVQVSPQLAVRDEQGRLHVLAHVSAVEIDPSVAAPVRAGVVWEVESERDGQAPVLLRYETSGLSWRAEYTVTLEAGDSENRGRMELAGAFVVENHTEVSWSEAQLYLVAGEVHRAAQGAQPMLWQREATAMMKSEEAVRAQPAGEYYEYAVPRPVSLVAGSLVRLESLGTARGVPYQQEFVCRNRGVESLAGRAAPILEREPGGGTVLPVEVFLRFRNVQEDRLGIPLPAGVVRIGEWRATGAHNWRFLGEAELQHVPVGEEAVVPVGNAFDVVAERKQKDFLVNSELRRLEEEVAVEIRNQKQKPVQVRVLESLYRAQQWEITASDVKYAKKDARTIEFVLDVPAAARKSVTYRVRYSW
ncbi:MAG: DUF4139 domain-containing protein [Candidatus Binatia bacterium]|nr:DUF4139 domain-containing protein [Candidatus Binatia bacterium]